MHTVLLYRDQTAYSVLYQLNCCLKLCSCSVCMKLGTGQKVWGEGVGRSREGVGYEVLSLVQGVGLAICSYP